MTRLTVYEYAAALRFARGQALRPRCWAAKKREKGKILDELCRTAGLHRKTAIRLLRSGGKLKPVRSPGSALVLWACGPSL